MGSATHTTDMQHYQTQIPYLWAFQDIKTLILVLKEVYETIVNRDLVQKYNLPDTQVLRQLTEFLMDNISNLTSPNKISDILKAHDVATNHVTIGKYIKYLYSSE